MPVPAITALYAGLLGLLGFLLATLVVRQRFRQRVALGDAGNPQMLQTMRVFANFAEYVPLVLLLMALGEMLAAPRWLTHALGVVLVAARLLHAAGLARNRGRSLGRFTGTAGTWLALLGASVSLIWLALARGIG